LTTNDKRNTIYYLNKIDEVFIMELFNILKSNKLFDGLNDEEVGKVAEICNKKEYDVGSVIFNEGSNGTGMYILVEGQVDIQMSMGIDDEPSTVHVIHEREVFGELSLVDRIPRSATARSAGKSVAFLLEADKFKDLSRNNTRIGYIVMRNIAHIVSSRLRKTNIKYTESLIWEKLSSDLNE
jgi:CRP-like cAMP-binding protein